MPPKSKLYKTSGKFVKNCSLNSPPGSLLQMTPAQEDQFQVELYWCIQQLQTALESGKLNNKQCWYNNNIYIIISIIIG